MKRRDFVQLISGTLAAAALTELPSASGQTLGSKTAAPKLAPRFGDGRDWWFERRFGLFVHWGLYSIHGWHEQEQWRRRVPRAEYERLAQQWNPTRFNPDAWLDLAEAAGMKYLCLTTKHHDGFCLWDTKLTPYNTMNTPYGRDVLRQVADACHRRGFPLCLYYSIADWHHPNYPNQGRHHELPPQPGDHPDFGKYLEFVRGQVRELCTSYGAIHGIWWDMNVGKEIDPSINAMIRELQPNAVINDRGFDRGDFGTPERDFVSGVDDPLSFSQRTEACQSVGSESWGYRRDEDYYSDRHLIASIDKYLTRDANYLLNVGPQPDGQIPAQAAAILRRIGVWYRSVRESLDRAEPFSQITSNRNVWVTRQGNALFVHLYQVPLSSAVKLRPLATAPRRATLLNTGQPVQWALDLAPSDHLERKAFLRLHGLPVNELADTVPVIKLEFDEIPRAVGREFSSDTGAALR